MGNESLVDDQEDQKSRILCRCKREAQQVCSEMEESGEESLFLSVNVFSKAVTYLGSNLGRKFLMERLDVIDSLYSYCNEFYKSTSQENSRMSDNITKLSEVVTVKKSLLQTADTTNTASKLTKKYVVHSPRPFSEAESPILSPIKPPVHSPSKVELNPFVGTESPKLSPIKSPKQSPSNGKLELTEPVYMVEQNAAGASMKNKSEIYCRQTSEFSNEVDNLKSEFKGENSMIANSRDESTASQTQYTLGNFVRDSTSAKTNTVINDSLTESHSHSQNIHKQFVTDGTFPEPPSQSLNTCKSSLTPNEQQDENNSGLYVKEVIENRDVILNEYLVSENEANTARKNLDFTPNQNMCHISHSNQDMCHISQSNQDMHHISQSNQDMRHISQSETVCFKNPVDIPIDKSLDVEVLGVDDSKSKCNSVNTFMPESKIGKPTGYKIQDVTDALQDETKNAVIVLEKLPVMRDNSYRLKLTGNEITVYVNESKEIDDHGSQGNVDSIQAVKPSSMSCSQITSINQESGLVEKYNEHENRTENRTEKLEDQGDGLHHCYTCFMTFKNASELKVHNTSEHAFFNPFKCKFENCQESFCKASALESHNYSVHNQKSFVCSKCGEIFHSKKELGSHRKLYNHGGKDANEEPDFGCKTCGKKFYYKSALSVHERTHTDNKRFICKFCSKAFSLEHYLKRHLTIHMTDKPYKCNKCDKQFASKANYEIHLKSHSGILYSCDVCGKEFRADERLRAHKRIHTDIAAHECKVCGKRFKLAYYLKTHMQIHEAPGHHICEVCGKKCKTKKYLSVHKQVHRNDSIYKCLECGKEFNVMRKLSLHLKLHTDGEEPYVCEVCGMQFKVDFYLKRHRKIHSGLKFTCDICGRIFSSVASRKRHFKNFHSTK